MKGQDSIQIGGDNRLSLSDVVEVARDLRAIADISEAVCIKVNQTSEWVTGAVQEIGKEIVRYKPRDSSKIPLKLTIQGSHREIGNWLGHVANEMYGEDLLVRLRRQPEAEEIGANDLAVAVSDLLRGHPLAVGGHHDRSAVLVRTTDHEHVVPPQTVVAREHIRRNAEARDVPDVARTVRIRPRDRDENLLRLGRLAHGGQS